jgi:hypothetical protein
VTAEDIKGTLAYLVPGFVALKVFYILGLRTRRSDFEWTVLSIATAAFLNYAVVTYLGATDALLLAVDATVLGIGVAIVAAGLWRLLAERRWRRLFDRQAWDAAFDGESWVSVWVKDGPVVFGWPKTVSESAQTDDQDVFITQPSWVDRSTGAETLLPTVRGIWIPVSQVELIQVMAKVDKLSTPIAGAGQAEPGSNAGA